MADDRDKKDFPIERVCELLIVSDRADQREVLIGFMDEKTRQAFDLFVMYDAERAGPDQYTVDDLHRAMEDALPILRERAAAPAAPGEKKTTPCGRIRYPQTRRDERKRNILITLKDVEELTARLREIKARKDQAAVAAPAEAAVNQETPEGGTT